MQVELDLTFLLNFSRKLFFIKNDVEMLFFLKTGFKIGVRKLYTGARYTRVNTVMRKLVLITSEDTVIIPEEKKLNT